MTGIRTVKLQNVWILCWLKQVQCVLSEAWTLDSNLAHFQTVGACWKNFTWKYQNRIWLWNFSQTSHCLQESCIQFWTPFVRGQTLFTWHRPHTSYWLSPRPGTYLVLSRALEGGEQIEKSITDAECVAYKCTQIIMGLFTIEILHFLQLMAPVGSWLQALQFDSLVGACTIHLVTVFVWQLLSAVSKLFGCHTHSFRVQRSAALQSNHILFNGLESSPPQI